MRLGLVVLLLSLISCRHGINHFNDEKIPTYKDIETLSSPVEESEPTPAKPVKKRVPPPPLFEGFERRVSLSVTETLPLKKVLPELARQVGANLQLDPKVEDKLYFHAENEKFIDIIEQLSALSDWRYVITGKSIRIEKDTPYSKNYNVQFLNLSRSTENKVSIATDVFATNRKTGHQGDNGSHSSVNMVQENNFWKELEASLSTLLSQDGKGSSFSIHKQGGIISVNATEKQHRLLKEYLEKLQASVSTQVLIEAKIIEVNLSDQYRSGINWQKLARPGDFRVNARFGDLSQSMGSLNPADAQGGLVSFGMAGKTFSSILNAIEQFGSSRILSSPRITALNNQTAILKVARNEVYFKLNYTKTSNINTARDTFNVSSDIQTVPIGLIMTVQPSIDDETGEVLLSLRPTISKLARSVNDPSVDLTFQAIRNQDNTSTITPTPSSIPVVEVREMDSVIRLKSGEIGVMGGLMEVRSINGRSQLPGIGELPLVGELVKSRADGDEVVELVILMKATIVNYAPAPTPVDNRLYHGYVKDPRQ